MQNSNLVLTLVAPDSLFAGFPSLSDFDDTYTCDVCIDTHLCSVCAEIEDALQVDISSDISYEISTDKVDVAYVNVVYAAKISPSIVQPSALELQSLPAFLEFNENLSVIISSKLQLEHEQKLLQLLLEHKKEIGWTLDDIPDIRKSMCMHRILLEDGAKAVRHPLIPLILDVVKDDITFTCPFDTFTYRRFFFDPGIKGEGEHYPKLLHQNSILEREVVEDPSLRRVAHAITYPP